MTKLTNNSLDEQAPKVNATGEAVWSAWDGADFEIYYWNGSTVQQLTNNTVEDRYPSISENAKIVVWMRHDPVDKEWEIYRKDASNLANPEVAVTANTVNDFYPKVTSLSGTPRVVWLRPNTSRENSYHLCYRDGGNAEVSLASNALVDHDGEQLDPQISTGGMITWVADISADVSGDWHIFRWNGSSVVQLSSSSSSTSNFAPQIDTNGSVVWQGWNVTPYLKNWDIYKYDGSGMAALTSDPNDDVLPHIHSNRVVWMRSSGFGYEIYRKEGANPELRLTTNVSDDLFPRINSTGHVVWLSAQRGARFADVYIWDGATTLELTIATALPDGPPQIDNAGRALWLDIDDVNDWEVYRHTVSAVRSVSFAATTIARGGSTTGTVTLVNPAPTGGAVVSLYVTSQGVVSIPSTVTVPAGQSSATFAVSSGSMTTTLSTTVRALYGGDEQRAPITVATIRRICVFRPSSREWFIREYDGTATVVQYGGVGDQPMPADYRGTGRDQIAVFSPGSRTWYIRYDDGAGQTSVQFGDPGDKPIPADYLGLNHAQVAVYRPSMGQWRIRDDVNNQEVVVGWGMPDDEPVGRDYFQWGRAQITVMRPSSYEWFVRDEVTLAGARIVQWGGTGDQAMPRDYFGWGRDQIAVYRPGTGEWFLRDDTGIATVVLLGQTGDKAVPADYLGLGRAQLAVYRPMTGQWLIRADDGTILTVPWGQVNSDEPVPGKYSGL